MEILVNGAPWQVAEEATALDLVRNLGLEGKRLAVEINQRIVPRSQYAQHRLRPGDRVEIVHAIGGG